MSTEEENVRKILEALGDKENIQDASHCVTRLRLILNDESKVDEKKLDENDLVKGHFNASGQYQVVIGQGTVDRVFDKFIQMTDIEEKDVSEVKDTAKKSENKNWFKSLIRTLADIFIPILPAIVASGLLMGINNVIANPGLFGELAVVEMYPNLSGIAGIINLIANTAFTFLPALIGWSAVRKFGGNPLLGIVLGLIMVHPELMSAYDFAADPSSAPVWNVLGLEINQVGYQGQVLPVLLSAYILAKTEVFLKNKISDTYQMLLVAPISLLFTGFLTFLFIGPITMAGANLITGGVLWLFEVQPVLAGALYALISPPLIVTGMHHLFLGVNLQMAGSLGYVTLWPIGETVTLAMGGATLAMFFILKKHNEEKLASVSITSMISAWLGITEPAIYGINLRFRYPFLAVMLGSSVGSAYLAYSQVKATSVGVGGVFSILSVFPEYWPNYIIGELLALVITMVLVYVFYKMNLFNGNNEFISEKTNS
jgi:PTS system trehalose-specific IIC component